ncbi:MAG: hypothetical protein HDQ98_11730 [Lachnospiraceae bacterium]|nr:hypothetical protein [Lachnospiraceae bacterium]
MKLQVLINATVYKTKSNTMTDRENGREVEWYQVVLDQNEDVDTFTCSESVYVNARRGQECTLLGEYDTKNKRFKITDIARDKSETSGVPESPDVPAGTPAVDISTDAPEAADAPAGTPAETSDDQPAKKGKRS